MMCVIVCVPPQCLWKSEDNFWELVLSFRPQSQGLITAPLPARLPRQLTASLLSVRHPLPHHSPHSVSFLRTENASKILPELERQMPELWKQCVIPAILSSLMLANPNAILLILQDPESLFICSLLIENLSLLKYLQNSS